MMEMIAPAGAESPGRKDWMIGMTGVGVGGLGVGVEAVVVPQAVRKISRRLKPTTLAFLFTLHLPLQITLER
jgi:hypothetical protein